MVQGSVLGPSLFNLNSCALKSFHPDNKYFKYADDAYLIVPCSNVSTISQELIHHTAWAAGCNLKLNPSKTSEIVFCRKNTVQPPPNPGISRVNKLSILRLTVDNKLNFSTHVKSKVTSCNQSLYALRVMRQHGLPSESLQKVLKATSLS